MTILYGIILIAFIVTLIFLMRSIFIKKREKFILTRASEKITDGYLIFSTNGRITNYNKMFLEAFNINKKSLKNKNIYDLFNENLVDEENVKKISEACKKVKNSNEIIRFDIKINERILKLEIKSIVNNDIFLRYVIVCKDVTNAYEIIQELHTNQDMMANREKFATLGQLISRNSTFFKISDFFNIWWSRGT